MIACVRTQHLAGYQSPSQESRQSKSIIVPANHQYRASLDDGQILHRIYVVAADPHILGWHHYESKALSNSSFQVLLFPQTIDNMYKVLLH
jgi:hypothetical protein